VLDVFVPKNKTNNGVQSTATNISELPNKEKLHRTGEAVKDKILDLRDKTTVPPVSTVIGTVTGVGVTTGLTALAGLVGFAAESLASTLIVPMMAGTVSAVASTVIRETDQDMINTYKQLKEDEKKQSNTINTSGSIATSASPPAAPVPITKA
jgi:hypothetical protein